MNGDRIVGLITATETEIEPVNSISALMEISQTLRNAGSLRDVFSRALEVWCDGSNSQRATIMTGKDGPDSIEIVAEYNPAWQKTTPRRLLLKSPVISAVLMTGEIVSGAIQKSPSAFALRNGRGQSKRQLEHTFVCLPLLAQQNRILGVLYVELPPLPEFQQRQMLETLHLVGALFGQALTIHQLLEATSLPLPDENSGLREELSERYDFSRIIGNSGPMRQVYEQIAQVACTNATVLISGESGTGKELIAHALHINSPRADGPFIKVNCGALTESLIESELFGHERGAFTGAHTRKSGRFELADGGTLLLDEIGELSLIVQTKLLRVVESGEFERVGGTETIRTDVRLIAATNRELEKEVAAGRFRADLYYRLNLFPIIVPPLRDRREDIPMLAEHLLIRLAREHRKELRGFSPHALELLTNYGWPGNVRELENTMERAVVVADGQTVQHFHLPPVLQTTRMVQKTINAGLFESVEAYEKDLICAALSDTRGNRNQAAKLLQVSERVLSYKVKKYAIDCDAFRLSK